MTKAIYLFACLLTPLLNFGQDTLRQITKKSKISIQGGVYYKSFLGDKYIKPSQFNLGDEFKDHQYERFSVVPKFGFSIGILNSYRIIEQWGITSGILYFSRKDLYENNQDTIIKYGNRSSIRNINNILKYDYSFNNIELPILVYYSNRKINFYAGVQLAVLTYKKAIYTYVINQFPQNPQWKTSNKTIEGFEIPLIVSPTLQIAYNTLIMCIEANPFIGLYYSINIEKSFYMQLGINLPLRKKSNTLTSKI